MLDKFFSVLSSNHRCIDVHVFHKDREMKKRVRQVIGLILMGMVFSAQAEYEFSGGRAATRDYVTERVGSVITLDLPIRQFEEEVGITNAFEGLTFAIDDDSDLAKHCISIFSKHRIYKKMVHEGCNVFHAQTHLIVSDKELSLAVNSNMSLLNQPNIVSLAIVSERYSSDLPPFASTPNIIRLDINKVKDTVMLAKYALRIRETLEHTLSLSCASNNAVLAATRIFIKN